MVKVGDIEVVPGFIIAETDLRERFSHSSGPGGQGVNTTDSRVELMFDVARSGAVPDRLRPVIMAVLKNRLVDGVLTVTVHDERSQLANRKLARARRTVANGVHSAAATSRHPAYSWIPASPLGC